MRTGAHSTLTPTTTICRDQTVLRTDACAAGRRPALQSARRITTRGVLYTTTTTTTTTSAIARASTPASRRAPCTSDASSAPTRPRPRCRPCSRRRRRRRPAAAARPAAALAAAARSAAALNAAAAPTVPVHLRVPVRLVPPRDPEHRPAQRHGPRILQQPMAAANARRVPNAHCQHANGGVRHDAAPGSLRLPQRRPHAPVRPARLGTGRRRAGVPNSDAAPRRHARRGVAVVAGGAGVGVRRDLRLCGRARAPGDEQRTV